jgi:8-oxo-dGTP pyrophosphatase MutT (NUDIX family)
MMEPKINGYGDLMFHYDEAKQIPDISFAKHHVIITHAPDTFVNLQLPYLLGKTKVYGNIFGNEYAHIHFPVIKDKKLQGGCTVVLAHHHNSVYSVLVQVKNRRYVMHPAGYMDHADQTIKDAAIREVWEETGLRLKPSEWNLLATWDYEAKFAGLSLKGHTTAGVCWVNELPSSWTTVINGPVTVIPIENNDEVENIVLLDIKELPKFKKLTFPSEFGGHHFNILFAAATREGLLNKQDITYEPISYLSNFNFL